MSPATTPKSIDELSNEEAIDEFAELDREYQLLKPNLDRRSLLRERVNGLAALHLASQPLILHGNLYELHLSARRHEYSWTNKLKLWRALGGLKRGALALFNPPFRAVQAIIGESAARALQEKQQTGYRTIVPVLKAPAQQAPAGDTAH